MFLIIQTYKHIAVIKESVTYCQENVFLHLVEVDYFVCILVFY